MLLESQHDGLSCQSTIEYNIGRSGRLIGNGVQRTIQAKLPLFLSLETWARHGYTLCDIRETLEYFPSGILWQWAIFHGITPTSSAIKVTSMDLDSIIHVSKSVVIKKILKLVTERWPPPIAGSVLDKTRSEFKPRLPVHALSESEWNLASSLIPQTVSYSQPIYLKQSFDFREVTWAPLEQKDGQIYAIRIVSDVIFRTSGRSQEGVGGFGPMNIHIQGAIYHNVDEACLLELGW